MHQRVAMNECETEGRQQREGSVTKAVAGMRGGLGRILLTAFMLLAIVPLSIISYVAIRRVRADIRDSAIEGLSQAASSISGQLQSWLNLQQRSLALLSEDAALVRAFHSQQWDLACAALEARASTDSLTEFAIGFPSAGSGMSSTSCSISARSQEQVSAFPTITADVLSTDGSALGTLTARANLLAFARVASTPDVPADARAFLVDEEGALLASLTAPADPLPAKRHAGPDVPVDGQGGWVSEGSGFMTNALGEAVAVAYRWLPGREVGVWVEQGETAIRAQEDDFAAMLIGGTLAVALLTAVLAAVITRQLTQPIVSLTQSAVRIAGGDLTQAVDLDRRDEIGVLARAFNVMTAELRSLYEELEHKVAERTRQLVEANLELRYKAMQLKLGAEMGRIATSILDLDLLLYRVTNLIQETYAHVYDVQYVSIWLQDEFGDRLERQSFRGHAPDVRGSAVAVGDSNILGQTASDGRLRLEETETGGTRVVIALRVGDRTIGALDLRCAQRGALGQDDIEALQSLGDQISVAIENARLYSAERDAVQRLSQLDDLRLASLSSGSHELATELNTIIGFSRLVLKGIDGPLTDLQRADLQAIYRSGYKLLGLIDNVIALSGLESGSLGLDSVLVDVDALLGDVLKTAASRLPDVLVDYFVERPLPAVWGDRSLLRQAFVGLVMAAADQLLGDLVHVRAYAGRLSPIARQGEDWLCIEIGGIDGGAERSVLSPPDAQQKTYESGIAVALAREVIALHGGKLRLEFEASHGLHCRAELPVRRAIVADSHPQETR
jgi:signal transduction histidine kinase